MVEILEPPARRSGSEIEGADGPQDGPGAAVPSSRDWYRDRGKRLLDIALVILSAPLVVPVTVILMGLIWLGGGAPVYRQARIGQHGKVFSVYKLRTMVPDAEATLADLVRDDPGMAEEWATTQKLSRDPRVTGFGRILRATSMDELPQFWNVLRGDMSLVGPRPMMPDQRQLYDGDVYFGLRPGITGLWQVSARNATSFGSRADYDRSYAERLSLRTDVALLFRTVLVVLRGTGC